MGRQDEVIELQILVTGGMGFIGSNFVRYMLNKYDHEILILDKLTYAGNPDNLKDLTIDERLTFVEGDICDNKIVNKLMDGVDWVVNFAAETHVDRSIHNAGDFIRTDVFGVFVLLEASKKFGVKRFLQISTDEVYGEAHQRPSKENDPLMPKSPYAASKAGGVFLVFSYFTTYKLPVVISRCSNNYGPYQYPEKLVPLFVTNALEDKQLPVYGEGDAVRDWIHVEDHCIALDHLLQEEGIEGEVYNISANEEHSVMEMTDIILGELDKSKDLITYVEERLGAVKRHAVDSNKLRNNLGWKLKHDFREALKNTVKWYVENEGWWRKIKEGEEFKKYWERVRPK